jgi:RecB family exonuclease
MNFEYTDIEVPEGSFKISPSGISKFFDVPSVWYRDNFLGENSFTGNTASELGTIIHAIAEAYALDESTNREEVEAYLDTLTDPDIDKQVIRDNYPEMAKVLVNEYLRYNQPDKVEQPVLLNLGDDVLIGGTYDAIQGSTLIDYKTTAKKPNTETIPWNYKVQLMSYAYALRSNGVLIDRIRIVWVVKPTKTLPARVFVVNHMITNEDWQDIQDTLELMKQTIMLQRSNPEYTHLLYKSMKLKEN